MHRKSGVSSTTFMLLAVSFYLIFTTLPVTVLYVLNILFKSGDPTPSHAQIAEDVKWQRYLNFTALRTVVERLSMSHNALNFYIYLCTGPVFRRELKSMFIRYFCKKSAYQIPNTELDDLLATYAKPADATVKNNNGTVHLPKTSERSARRKESFEQVADAKL